MSAQTKPRPNNLTPDDVAALIHQWEAWIWKQAMRWKRINPRLDLEDLYAEVRSGFVLAASRWDPKRGGFATYATWWGNNVVRQFIRREAAHGLHVPQYHGIKSIPVGSIDVRRRCDDSPIHGYFAVERETEQAIELPLDFWEWIRGVLNDRQYAALAGKYREGRRLHEIGQQFGISKEAVRQHIVKATMILRVELPELAKYLEE